MSPLAPFQKWILRAGIVAALVVTLPLIGLRGVAHADLGDEPSSKPTADQADDGDKPKDPSLLDKKPADAAVQQQKQAPVGPPFYEKWEFWALSGAVVVLAIATIFWIGPAIGNQINGGDVRPCNPTFIGCGGEGR
jgi:DMSO/TMAO reductase YedYZ molybdopterin-dependent catalytic subunit